MTAKTCEYIGRKCFQFFGLFLRVFSVLTVVAEDSAMHTRWKQCSIALQLQTLHHHHHHYHKLTTAPLNR